MNVGLYFGSFNPIHVGHLIIANFVANSSLVDQVWFIISPQNPLKESSTLLNEYHRLHLVQIAIEDNLKLRASDVEFRLPKPSYTIDTLTYLKEKYPQHQFSVIIGSDSFQNLHKWKNYEVLTTEYQMIVYKRPGFEVISAASLNIRILDAPLLEISATVIRSFIQAGKSIQYLVPENVRKEIELNNYYK